MAWYPKFHESASVPSISNIIPRAAPPSAASGLEIDVLDDDVDDAVNAREVCRNNDFEPSKLAIIPTLLLVKPSTGEGNATPSNIAALIIPLAILQMYAIVGGNGSRRE